VTEVSEKGPIYQSICTFLLDMRVTVSPLSSAMGKARIAACPTAVRSELQFSAGRPIIKLSINVGAACELKAAIPAGGHSGGERYRRSHRSDLGAPLQLLGVKTGQ
jgi:hypothetical protein